MKVDVFKQTEVLNDIVQKATVAEHKDLEAQQALDFILRPCNWVNPSFPDHPERDQYVQLVTMLSLVSAIEGQGLEVSNIRLIKEIANRLKNHDPIGSCIG
jgi:hypothetical protein